MDNQRNLILAMALVILLLFGWDAATQYFYPAPKGEVIEQAQAGDEDVRRTREGGLTNPVAIAEERRDLRTQLADTSRVPIDSAKVSGSINPVGARIDDLTLKTHRETIDRNSGPVRLFSPAGTPAQHFAQFGFVGTGIAMPGPETVWETEGGSLSSDSPVTLTWNNGSGQIFQLRFTIDDEYMITVTQSVANTASGPVAVQPYGFINRTSETASTDTWTVHSGPIGAFDGSVAFDNDYEDIVDSRLIEPAGRTDWVGFTDIYWLSALVPDPQVATDAAFRALGGSNVRADLIYDPVTIVPGKQFSRTTRLFAGAKESEVLDAYEDAGIANFGLAIDWGWFRWFEKPIFWLLKELFDLAGNFGVAIIALTFVVRLIMFPVAQRQFKSMAAMKALQPKMKALQERHKDDRTVMQQEVMALYKREKVNPLAGCLPMFLQIPVFFALYKVLMLAIEMRHQPFALWIRDLSAPDPAMILNLFGLLDFTPPGFLSIGILALLLGLSMWLQFRLNPAQMDPQQQKIFMIMPWILMFVMAPFAAGLLLYWITSNFLTIAQQKLLYLRHPQLQATQADEAKASNTATPAKSADG
ncbi:membrane protein insertase YidC [Croceicoccus sp. F390]|uniref:Membrane protein insertase YidC n=1 Tax=Croceicoccus esteveae TaxID=3075597 RepID=A0ABU2ZJJ3_9SPHN|nr:membrane protein insertase YidC [Croceicoccus sp. F390]MDT0576776.1 membrane protein insertase YidC [Croceicoccus sp. F390]